MFKLERLSEKPVLLPDSNKVWEQAAVFNTAVVQNKIKSTYFIEHQKDAALLPEKLNGSYVLFHKRIPDIWIAYSKDLINWKNHMVVKICSLYSRQLK